MTRRLYHEDSSLRSFTARVSSRRSGPDGTTEVILDRTAFYPTGGGQPGDLGELGGCAILEVYEEAGAVIHRVQGDPGGAELQGTVDWERRLDHRQQHTGQHILSRAIIEVAGARTVGFHLGADRSTIDLDREDPGEEVLESAEMRANEVITRNLPISVSWHEDASALPEGVQKEIPGTGPLRMVSVEGFDDNLCCGTHCERSGEVGVVKILRWERNKGGLRVEFVCGGRALKDYARRHRTLRGLALSLTTEEFEVPERVAGLQEDFKRLRSRLEKSENELRELLVEQWVREKDPGAFFRDLGPGRADWLASLASTVAERGGRPVLLVSQEEGGCRVAVGCPPGGPDHAGRILQELVYELEGKGGGSDRLARGQVSSSALPTLVSRWAARFGA